MLTDAKCRNAKCPQGKKRQPYADGNGLWLYVTPRGTKSWYMRPRIQGKMANLKLGDYPAMGLADARAVCAETRTRIAQGLPPRAERATFSVVAEEWIANHIATWSAHHSKRQRAMLDNDLLPALGEQPVADIGAQHVLAVLRKIEERGAFEQAHRALSFCQQIFSYAVATQKVRHNVCADLKGALKPRGVKLHFAAITEPAALGRLLHAIRNHTGKSKRRSLVVQAALELAPLLFQRPGNLMEMRWEELDLESGTWTIPSQKMKRQKAGKESGAPHIVPLARQAVVILKNLREYTDNPACYGWVFPGGRTCQKPLSANALRKALLDMGVSSGVQTIHGFRATARTMLDEQLKCDWRYIEAQLAHSVRDALGRTYNRTEYLPQRREMMQQWADYLDTLAARAADEAAKPEAEAAPAP